LILAILTGKLIAFLVKLAGGGATAAPGLIALKIDPNLVKKLSKKIKYGAIIISGTNGKTTTARLASDFLSSKFKTAHNRQGSNLLRGIASTLISLSSVTGKIRANLGLWEVDEATVPEAIKNTHPKIICLLNLFRDQLDRYGEVDTIRTKWQKALSELSKDTVLILNADDPGISILANFFAGKVVFFGVNDQKLDLPEITHVADIKHCLNCESGLKYTTLLSAHMGHYRCPNCNFKRPNPLIRAKNLKFKSDFSTEADFTIHSSLFSIPRKYALVFTLHYNLPGLYNVYNLLAAVTIGNISKIDHAIFKEKIEKFSAAFGRFQKIKVGKKEIVIFLIKNPTGANEVIRIIAQKDKVHLLTILNDNIADGKDVSWIWDTNWEVLAKKIKKASVSGTRSWDLATRFKYAEIELSKNNVYKNISYSIQKSIENLDNKNTLLILPTYTALLEVQKTLAKMEASTKWHED